MRTGEQWTPSTARLLPLAQELKSMTTPTAPRRALVVIDVQQEYFTGGLKVEYPPIDETLPRVLRAMDAAHAAGIPVIVMQHTEAAQAPLFGEGSNGWQLHDEVVRRPRDHYARKAMPSVFTGTDVAEFLQRQGIDTLAVVGYMTQNCEASTVYEAAHRGLNVEFLHDASGAISYANDAGVATAEEIHRVLSVIFHTRFAAVVDTATWVAAVRDGARLQRDNIPASYARAAALRRQP
jgi:nicotinamidase-related amidase